MNKQEIEDLIYMDFETSPFHNLYFYLNRNYVSTNFGGTCSDKVMSFYKKLKANNVSVNLHTAFINGAETHRLLKIKINEEFYFCDIGNGWPSTQMFPQNKNSFFKSFGIEFKSIVVKNNIEVYQKNNKEFKLSMIIPIKSKQHNLILNDIKHRFEYNSYPFLKGIRFAQVIKDKFYFLRDHSLFIYSENEVRVVNTHNEDISKVLSTYFNFNLKEFINNTEKRILC